MRGIIEELRQLRLRNEELTREVAALKGQIEGIQEETKNAQDFEEREKQCIRHALETRLFEISEGKEVSSALVYAMQALRKQFGIGLSEAKETVDSFRANLDYKEYSKLFYER